MNAIVTPGASPKSSEEAFFESQKLPSKARGMTFEALFYRQLHQVTARIHETENLEQIMLETSDDICKLLNADRLTLYAVNEDQSAIVSKIKTGLTSSSDLNGRCAGNPPRWLKSDAPEKSPAKPPTRAGSTGHAAGRAPATGESRWHTRSCDLPAASAGWEMRPPPRESCQRAPSHPDKSAARTARRCRHDDTLRTAYEEWPLHREHKSSAEPAPVVTVE